MLNYYLKIIRHTVYVCSISSNRNSTDIGTYLVQEVSAEHTSLPWVERKTSQPFDLLSLLFCYSGCLADPMLINVLDINYSY